MSIKLVETEPSCEASWVKILDFDDTSDSFALGFEAGDIFRQLRNAAHEGIRLGTEKKPLTVMTYNVSLYNRMAEVQHYYADSKPTEVEGWSYIWFTKKETTLLVV